MLRIVYYVALILGLYFIVKFLFKFVIFLLRLLIVLPKSRNVKYFHETRRNNDFDDTVIYKEKKGNKKDIDIIEFEEE